MSISDPDRDAASEYSRSLRLLPRNCRATVEAVVSDHREIRGKMDEAVDLCFLAFSTLGVFSLLRAVVGMASCVGLSNGTDAPRTCSTGGLKNWRSASYGVSTISSS